MYQEITKRLETQLHFINDMVDKGEVEIQKVHTDENHADILTKPLSVRKFKCCLDLLNIYVD